MMLWAGSMRLRFGSAAGAAVLAGLMANCADCGFCRCCVSTAAGCNGGAAKIIRFGDGRSPPFRGEIFVAVISPLAIVDRSLTLAGAVATGRLIFFAGLALG